MSPSLKTMADAIRMLSVDAVQKAVSGHPGMPMGMADIATVLWHEYLKFNPADPHWRNRDRFVLSNGHGSMLLYALLHLTGYDVSIEDLKQFRQWHSKTPGHPEQYVTPGVETTTGPLGQGLANGVGMAIAERLMASQFNRPGFELVNHHTYVFCGDGCLMEGISHEVCSLAGTLGLNKLIVFWDDNGISIDGPVAGWFTENIPDRFRAYQWNVIDAVDGHDPEAIRHAIEAAHRSTQPTLIACKTIIGKGSPRFEGTAKAHGAPLGTEEIAEVRRVLNWPHAPFEIPSSVQQAWNAREKGAALQDSWETQWNAYQKAYPTEAAEWDRRMASQLPEAWPEIVAQLQQQALSVTSPVATRKSSQQCLNILGPALPELVGGSADLSESNLTHWSGALSFTREEARRYVNYGVREFGMAAILNGLQLYGGWIPFGATFLTFSDYARNAIRMAALMKIGVIFVFTHDSIGLGEDGPTHQPVEHLAMLRATPGLNVWRPCDAFETAIAWQQAIEQRDRPTSLILSRQNLAPCERTAFQQKAVQQGAYVLYESGEQPELIILATGSEVSLALQAAKLLSADYACRVVSMPCMERFKSLPRSQQESVLPASIKKRVSIEAAATLSWHQWVGLEGLTLGVDEFGHSAPAQEVYRYFGLETETIVSKIRDYMKE